METVEQRRARMTRNTRAWRLRHPDRVKTSRKLVYNNRKRRAMEMIGGARCVKCGCDHLEFLEINHKNGGGCQEHKMSGRIAPMDRILSGKRSTEGLNVLCRVCNALDYLYRKNPDMAKNYAVMFCNYTGQDKEEIYGKAA